MRSAQLEHWVRQTIEQMNTEDSRIEFKAQWIDPAKAARRIAGHCNAAQGEPVLWIFGVDEKTKTVTGVDDQEQSTWWDQVKAQFAGPTPAVQHLAIAVDDKQVVALLFDTEQAPFLTKTPDSKTVTREVPWREATATRTATREELLKILVPRQAMPTLDVIDADANLDKNATTIHAYIHVYAALPFGQAAVLPDHQSSGTIEVPDIDLTMDADESEILAGRWSRQVSTGKGSVFAGPEPVRTVHQGEQQVILEGPGFFRFHLRFALPQPVEDTETLNHPIRLGANVVPAGGDVALRVAALLQPRPGQPTDTYKRGTLLTWMRRSASP